MIHKKDLDRRLYRLECQVEDLRAEIIWLKKTPEEREKHYKMEAQRAQMEWPDEITSLCQTSKGWSGPRLFTMYKNRIRWGKQNDNSSWAHF